MPQYDYICMNPNCTNEYFSVVESIAQHVDAHDCPICMVSTKSRLYTVPPVVYKAHNVKQAAGFSKLEEDMTKQSKDANNIADNLYANRSKQGYKKWAANGGEDQLYEDLAKCDFKPDKSRIISSSAGTTVTSGVSSPGA